MRHSATAAPRTLARSTAAHGAGGRNGRRAPGRHRPGARRHQRPVHRTAPHRGGQRRRHRGANHRALRARRPCRRIDQARRTGAGNGQSGRVEVVTDGCRGVHRGGRREWHQGEQETHAAIIEHRAAGLSWAKVAVDRAEIATLVAESGVRGIKRGTTPPSNLRRTWRRGTRPVA